MALDGDLVIDLNVADVNPYVNADMVPVNRPGKIVSGGWQDNISGGGPSKMVVAADVDRTKTLIAKCTRKEAGILWGDRCGPALMNEQGQGYVVTLVGTEFRIRTMESASDGGTQQTYQNVTAEECTGDVELEIHMTPDGKISTYVNGVLKANGWQGTNHIDTVKPGCISEHLNTNAVRLSSFAAEGLEASVVAPSWNGVPDPPPATEGVFYEYEFGHLIDGDGPFTVENIGDFGPSGWAIVDTHFGGVAANNGDFPNINLRAHNESGITADSGPFVITVVPALEAPGWLADPAPPVATVGVAYNYSFANLLTGDTPITVSLIGAALPSWASLVDHTIVGTPDVASQTDGLQFSALGQAPPNAETGLFSLTVDAVAVPGPKIDGVNGDDSIINDQPGTIQGSELTDTVSVLVEGVPFTFTVASDALVSFEALDVHHTSLGLGLAEMVLSTNTGSVSFGVLIKPAAGSTYVVATSIDTDPEHPGLLHATTEQAEVGDIYEGWEEQAALNTPFVYSAAGPHRSNIPPLPDDTITIGWFYDVSTKSWEEIREITRQSAAAAPVISNPRHDVPVAHDEIVGYFDTTMGTGTGYALATLTAVEPSVEDIVNGIGEAADSRPADVEAGEGPFVLDGLTPYTRYYYWFVQDSDNAGNYSNIVGGTALTAQAPVGPPAEGILAFPYHGAVGPDFGNVGCTSDTEGGLIYYVARLSSDQPTPEEIHFGIGASAHTYAPAVKGINGPVQLRGLDPTQLYYYWMVQDVNADRTA